MNVTEHYLPIYCKNCRIDGILHKPSKAHRVGIVIVVGGPQYRIGSHRQFVLIARKLSEQGFSVLRFDYRGMGESEGDVRTFQNINDDIRSAINSLKTNVEGVEKIILWGLCDAATAISFYANQDDRIIGLVMINPWVRSEQGEARAYIRHYYYNRLFSKKLWKKIIKGQFDILFSLKSLSENIFKSFAHNKIRKNTEILAKDVSEPLHERMYKALFTFDGKVLIILCENDLTAAEFSDTVMQDKKWDNVLALERFQIHKLAGANHTFSKRVWRDKVTNWTIDWVNSL